MDIIHQIVMLFAALIIGVGFGFLLPVSFAGLKTLGSDGLQKLTNYIKSKAKK